MGKLADRLKEQARGGAQPMGFTPLAAPSAAPAMVVMAQVESGELEAVSQAVRTEADGVLVSVGPATPDQTLRAMRTAARQALWGGVLAVGTREAVERLQRAGCDFVVLGSGALPADILAEEKLDKVLEVDPEWSDVMVRGLEQLPLAAVAFRVVTGETMTIHRLLLCQRVVALTRKPVLAVLPPAVGPDQLLPLRDAGVSGIIVPAGAAREFRKAVRELPPPKRPRERLEAVLPLGLTVARREREEEEEEGDGAGASPLG